MQCSPEIDKLAAALVKAQATFPDVGKASTAKITSKRTGQSFNYTFATMPDVQHALLPTLHSQGIAVMQGTVDEDQSGFTVLTTLLHSSGQWITHRVRVPMADTTAQAAGSALSYGRRVGLVAAVCAVTDEVDDDGAAASVPPKPKAKPTTEKLVELEALAADPRWTETQSTKLRERAKKASAEELDTLIVNAIESLAKKETQ